MFIRSLALVFFLFCFVSMSWAQTDFFFSFQNLGEGVSNEEPTRQYSPGDIGFLYLYFTTNGPADSNRDSWAFLDIQTSIPGVIAFTFAETLNFEISPTNEFRWCDSAGSCGFWGEPEDLGGSVASDFIDELAAFVIFDGPGILEDNSGQELALDSGYDMDADAFQFARINFVVLESTGGESVDILVSPGTGGIVNNGELLTPTFGTATVVVGKELVGDVNCDGEIDLLDVAPFVVAITAGDFFVKADINQDGYVDLLDVAPFVDLLTG